MSSAMPTISTALPNKDETTWMNSLVQQSPTLSTRKHKTPTKAGWEVATTKIWYDGGVYQQHVQVTNPNHPLFNETGWKNLDGNGMVWVNVRAHGDPIQKVRIKKSDLTVLDDYVKV